MTELEIVRPAAVRQGHLDTVSSAMESAIAAAEHLSARRNELVRLLTTHESHEAAADEVDRSIDALRNLHRELPFLRTAWADTMAVYLPINLPLYSIVLFGAIPSVVAGSVSVRMPAATTSWHRNVFAASRLGEFFPRLRLLEITRRAFEEAYVSCADVVVFTGRFENAEQVRRSCPQALFIFEGSGPNPIVIGPRADLDNEFDRYLSPRLFNGGQDCAGPDAYLVHSNVVDSFIERLRNMLLGQPTGTYRDPNVRLGPILNRHPLGDLRDRLVELRKDVVLGGNVMADTGIVEPTVIVRHLLRHDRLFEFFAPVFYVLEYDSVEQLEEFFNSSEYRAKAMYVSVFGERALPTMHATSTVLLSQTILEVERGNDPYGGYGPRANFVSRGGEVLEVAPILISSCLARYCGLDELRMQIAID